MSRVASRRLEKERRRIQDDPIPGVTVLSTKDDLSEWLVQLEGADGTLYAGERYTLRLQFGSGYPLESPDVQFVPPAPIHPHIYSNGHICLSILYDEWSPALTVKAICLSILSMLSSCPEKKLPSNNDRYVRHAPASAKKTNWAFDDDKV